MGTDGASATALVPVGRAMPFSGEGARWRAAGLAARQAGGRRGLWLPASLPPPPLSPRRKKGRDVQLCRYEDADGAQAPASPGVPAHSPAPCP